MPMQPSTPTPSQPSQGAIRRPQPGLDDGLDDPLSADDAPMASDDDAVIDDSDAMALGDTGGDQGGEGNIDAARRHRASVERFVADGRVDQAARDAKPASDDEARALRDAEDRGRDPARD